MNSKRIMVAVVLALAIAGVVSWGFLARVRMQRAEAYKTVKIVGAIKPLGAGSPITADSIALMDWPANLVPVGAFTNLNDVKDRSVIYPISEHQPILDKDVAQPGSGIGLTVKIPDGMRAVSVRSNDVVGVAGFLYPGSHVDVLVTSRPENNGSPLTQTILSNVEVLVAGQRTEPDPTGKPETVNVVTLLLKPEDGEKMVLASSQGQIQFVLRNGADQVIPDTKAVDMLDLMAGAKKPVIEKKIIKRVVPAPVAQTAKPAPPPVVYYEVETISGSKHSVEKFE
jgi:pilus assembly protein CpaB